MMIYLQVAQSELLFVITRNYFCTEEAFRENNHTSSINDFRFIHNITYLLCISILEKILFSSYLSFQKCGENSNIFATYCTSNISYIHSTFKNEWSCFNYYLPLSSYVACVMIMYYSIKPFFVIMVIEFNIANKPYEDVDVDMVTPKKSKQFQIITHGQTLNNKTRKKQQH